jgi:hypothetical protein
MKPGSEKNTLPNNTWLLCIVCQKDNGYDDDRHLSSVTLNKNILFYLFHMHDFLNEYLQDEFFETATNPEILTIENIDM